MLIAVLLACVTTPPGPVAVDPLPDPAAPLPSGIASDVPGWPDAECPPAEGGLEAEIVRPDYFRFEGAFLAGANATGPQILTISLHDCVNFACPADATTLNRRLPYLEATLNGQAGPYPERRGQGPWGPDATDPRHAGAHVLNAFGEWSNAAFGSPVSVTACLSRVRPDQVRGTIRTEVPMQPWGVPGEEWTSATIVYPFDIPLANRSGVDATDPDQSGAPVGFEAAHFRYEVPYEDAWPWDQITDPAVRADLYERFRPYNDP